MSSLLKRNGNFWPSMVQDFLGTENLRNWDDKFWLTDKGAEFPSANVIENDKDFRLELSAPGFLKKDFKIEFNEGILDIRAEKEITSEEEKEHYMKKEFSYSSIRRSFVIPENIMEDKIDAKYENGILKVIMPKKMIEGRKDKKAITVA